MRSKQEELNERRADEAVACLRELLNDSPKRHYGPETQAALEQAYVNAVKFNKLLLDLGWE